MRGKREEIRLALCCLLTEGHLLLDDVPGTGKTSSPRRSPGRSPGTWKRVQFTPDLLPTDITGVMVFDQSGMTFTFREGPGLHERADRRRDQPRQPEDPVGAARGDGGAPGHRRRHQPHRVPRPFLVIATQNPRDYQGTFPLPDVQLDRFAMRLTLGYADPATEVGVLEDYHREHDHDDRSTPVTDADELDRLIGERRHRSRSLESIHDYIVRLAAATRAHPDLRLGVSTRGTLTMLRVARAYAATDDRDVRDARRRQDDRRNAVFAHRMALTARSRTARRAHRQACSPTSSTRSRYPALARAEPLLTRSGVGAVLAAVAARRLRACGGTTRN